VTEATGDKVAIGDKTTKATVVTGYSQF